MSKSTMTIAQMGHIIRTFDKKGVTQPQYEDLNASGLLTDLLDAKDYKSVDRKAFRALLKGGTGATPATFPTLPARDPRFVLDLPVYASKEAFIQAVKDAGHQFSEYALSVIGHEDWKLLTEGGKYSFWEYTVRELTGKNEVKTPVFYEAIHFHQFIDAPQQSAGDLRIAYTDQPLNEWRPVMSDPVPGSDGVLAVLRVERYSRGSFVIGDYALPGVVWYGDLRVWVCRKLE